MTEKISKVMKVNLSAVKSDELFDYIVCYCNFCNKKSYLMETSYKDAIQLGHGYYYCPFCTRHRFNHKKKNHIFLMDFRGIIGFYINYLYYENSIWLSQILDYIKVHASIGIQNPVFHYDQESLLWFIDFTRVGKTKYKMPIGSVVSTTNSIIDSFNMKKNIPHCNVENLKNKYAEAITEYYSSRTRPEGKRILSPTLKGSTYRSQINWEESKDFYIDVKNDLDLETGSLISPLLVPDLSEPALDFLKIVVKKRIIKGVEGWEGSVELPGLAKSKIIAKNGSTHFEKRSSLSAIARHTAKKLGLKAQFEDATKKAPQSEETHSTT